jgi:hypothetical protein
MGAAAFMILETAAVLGCPLILGTVIGIVLRRRSGRRYAGVAAALAFVLLPIALGTVLTVYVPLVGLWDGMMEGVLCGVGMLWAAHRVFEDPRHIVLSSTAVVAGFVLLEIGVRLFLGVPPAFPTGDGPSFFLPNMLRNAAPDAGVFHAQGLPNFLARAVLRVDLARKPEFVPPSERAPAALLTTELVCAIAYGSAYTGFVDVSRERMVLFPERFTPRPGAQRRVLHIGDSMVFGANVPHDQTFAADLEKLEPGVQHINAGVSGMAPDDYLVVLRSWLAHQGVDLAVMYLFEGNDLNGLDIPHPCSNWEPILTYEGGHAVLRYPSPKSDQGTGWKWLVVNSPMPYAGRVMIAAHSAAAAFLGNAMASWSAHSGYQPESIALQHLEDILRSARDELGRRGIPFVVVVLPRGGRLRIGAPGKFATQVRAISDRLGLHDLDATGPIADALQSGESPLQFDDTHFNEAGHRLIANWLHEQLFTTAGMAAR